MASPPKPEMVYKYIYSDCHSATYRVRSCLVEAGCVPSSSSPALASVSLPSLTTLSHQTAGLTSSKNAQPSPPFSRWFAPIASFTQDLPKWEKLFIMLIFNILLQSFRQRLLSSIIHSGACVSAITPK